MTTNLGHLAVRAAAALGQSLDERASADVETWLTLLETWNARMDLTAARSPEELVDLMLADALVLAAQVARDARLIDVGTGAGSPGLALALLRPDVRTTLVEPRSKRVSFLRTVVGSLRRSDITIERVRAEVLASPGGWDVAVSRATFPPGDWLDLGTTLAAAGGAVWVLVANEGLPVHPKARLAERLEYLWPLTGVRRITARYVVLEKQTSYSKGESSG